MVAGISPVDAPARSRIPYEPGLDGLRGLSVLAIVLYHSNFQITRGAYLGVDAFFVLSGYLITSLLLAEWKSSGTIELRHFWERRARRLLPALFLLLVGVLIYAALAMRPDQFGPLRSASLSTLFYVANWYLIGRGVSYFDQFETSPLRHAWSLGIEEQFYLAWPLILVSLMWLATRVRSRDSLVTGRQLVLGFSLLGSVLSALWMAWLYDPSQDPSRIYFATDTRAQSILIGAALAAWLAGGPALAAGASRRWLVGAGTLAMLLTLLLWSRGPEPEGESWIYYGGFWIEAALVATVILGVTREGESLLKRFLGWPPLIWIGQLSYGLYLWHWLVYLAISPERTGIVDLLPLTVLRLGAIFGLASLSYYLVERPVRRGALGSAAAPVAGASLVAVLLGLAVVTRGAIPNLADYEAMIAEQTGAPLAEPGESPVRVLIVGDSVAVSVGAGFNDAVQREEDLLVWAQGQTFCQLAGGKILERGQIRSVRGCPDWPVVFRSYVEDFDPDVVLLITGGWEIFDRGIADRWLRFEVGELDARIHAAYDDAIDILTDRGAMLLLATSPYFTRVDTPVEWTAEGRGRVDHFNDLMRTIQAHHPSRVRIVDTMAWVCPGRECIEEVEGILLRSDGVHFTPGGGAELVARWLTPHLRAAARHD